MTGLKPDDSLWSFSTERFTVEFHATPEDDDPAGHFSDARDVAFARSGEPAAWFTAWVLVRENLPDDQPHYAGDAGEVLGYDVLGGCSYNSFREFMTSHRTGKPEHRNTLANKARGVCMCVYFPGMVSEAVKAARAELARRTKQAAGIKL